MSEVLRRPEHDRVWLDALSGVVPNWDDLFEGFQSTVDWPSAFFWRELAAYFPSAKVILTVRDEVQWYESIRQTIYRVLTQETAAGTPSEHRRMTRALVLDRVFEGRFDDPSFAQSVYRDHLAMVRSSLSADRLLVYATSEGWAPLCRFLDLDEPKTPFPHANSRGEFQKEFLNED